jgi:uncharacterized membrane protein YvbJ
MFCPYCGRNISDDEVFCPYCGKAQKRNTSNTAAVEPAKPQQSNAMPQVIATKKAKGSKISFNAVKAIITVVAIVVLLIVIFQIYYPSMLPWNW